MKLSELHTTLQRLGAQPTKSLGQNFLHDKNLAEWIVGQAAISPGDAWLEIGPGLGALTEIAARRSPHGTLIEKDDRLIAHLRDRFPQLRVIHADAAHWDVRELLPEGRCTIFGNLPYYVSSQILFNFTVPFLPAPRLIFTLQKELALRLAAAPGTRDFGAPTVLIGRRWNVRILKNLPPSVFTPVPKVESTVIALEPREAGELPVCEESRFVALVKQGFSQRRKQLGNLLDLADWPAAAAHVGVPVTARAESLSIAQWCHLAAWESGVALDGGGQKAQDVHAEIFDVVDENDVVVGQKTRHEVHQKKLRHRAVHIFVLNDSGELFLQRRSRWKDTHPLKWDSSAAGHVDSGETYEGSAKREIREELGIDASVTLHAKIEACAETGEEFVHLYVARHEGPFQLPPAEIDCGAWFSPQLIERWSKARPEDFASGFLKCWEHWRAR